MTNHQPKTLQEYIEKRRDTKPIGVMFIAKYYRGVKDGSEDQVQLKMIKIKFAKVRKT